MFMYFLLLQPIVKFYISLHLGLSRGRKPEGEGGNKRLGEGGGWAPGAGPNIPCWGIGEKEKLGVDNGGY